jgi:hypothetical protein
MSSGFEKFLKFQLIYKWRHSVQKGINLKLPKIELTILVYHVVIHHFIFMLSLLTFKYFIAIFENDVKPDFPCDFKFLRSSLVDYPLLHGLPSSLQVYWIGESKISITQTFYSFGFLKLWLSIDYWLISMISWIFCFFFWFVYYYKEWMLESCRPT